ncbi:hypothetical protein M9458_015723, partial [Cirrhinus mrigala]
GVALDTSNLPMEPPPPYPLYQQTQQPLQQQQQPPPQSHPIQGCSNDPQVANSSNNSTNNSTSLCPRCTTSSSTSIPVL